LVILAGMGTSTPAMFSLRCWHPVQISNAIKTILTHPCCSEEYLDFFSIHLSPLL
jgi:hypothetical protein